ncbi:ATP-binding protein [Halocynthiibacter styelae]|uniref:ATP-binding protein n=1 Tax=Halocynthiibacter styelae TaxID=2761955 RepID=A0A8J7LVD8_9RHOB|nr:ATP-binding protein [Paenihalocynthiibacter styelae]MBI1493177.1 ATP-binding protein [Paenihalocynthiibacter styelae]
MIEVGQVTAVVGVEITIKANENSSLETHFYRGQAFKGVSIREYITVDHGFREVVCKVEGEYLDESHTEGKGPNLQYVRRLKVRPIGYFEDEKFFDGIKFLPKIGDPAKLMSERKVEKIFERTVSDGFKIGSLMKEDLPISLPWQKIFNSHLGIFGNTGSGKSNTLTKLFTVLFENKFDTLADISQFVFLDFNGEYTGEQLVDSGKKTVLRLKTRAAGGDQFHLAESQFWDVETLGILFQATANTQKPFLRRIVDDRKRFSVNVNSLTAYVKSIFRRVLNSEHPSAEALELLKSLSRHLGIGDELAEALNKVGYHRNNQSFYFDSVRGSYFGVGNSTYDDHFGALVDAIEFEAPDGFRELQIRAELKLISDLLYGSVQYEHIQPLMRRIEALMGDFTKVIAIRQGDEEEGPVTVISLRECNQEIKKILPILIAKHYYEEHKRRVSSPPDRTMHLVIDEAHNILSQQSNREAESWKDYRLELFEEIIKEGRKFGAFMTLASQRPADISPTVVSQLHNYFIHRLVNDRDLTLLENTISTLDSISRSQIPSLPQGACVVTGTTFDIPMLLQVDKLPKEQEPDSSDVDLVDLWG